MNAKQRITVAAVLAATALGLAVPAYADDFDHRGHGPTVTEKQCRNGGGHVRDEEPRTFIVPAVPGPPPVPAKTFALSYPHCHDGKYSGMQVSDNDDHDDSYDN